MEGPPTMNGGEAYRVFLTTVASVLDGSNVELAVYERAAQAVVTSARAMWPKGVVNVSSSQNGCVVFGPIRAHAVDLAANLLRLTNGATPDLWPTFVFLGDYVDGGPQSIATLTLVLLLHLCVPERVVLLKGREEVFFPMDPVWTGPYVGRFDEEIRLACLRDASCAANERCNDDSHEASADNGSSLARELRRMREIEQATLRLFEVMPACCVVDATYFCVCGGLGPGIEKMTLEELSNALAQATAADQNQSTGAEPNPVLMNVVAGDPMDDDDDCVTSDAYYITNDERGVGYTYSFNAVCAFLDRNRLGCIIRGNGYTTNRFSLRDVNDCGRPWHYAHSPRDPGFRLYRRCPFSGLPSVVSLFSAPNFCCTNRNTGAFVELVGGVMKVRQFEADARRTLQLPGPSQNAFSWSLPLMALHLQSALTNMLFAPTSAHTTDSERAFTDEERAADMHGRLARHRRLCHLLSKRPGGLALLTRKGLAADL